MKTKMGREIIIHEAVGSANILINKRDAHISALEARTVVVPLPRVASISRRKLTARSYTLVRVFGPENTVGIGFSLSGEAATTIVRELIAPNVVGLSVFETERIWDNTYYNIILNGRRGAALRAMSAVDIALWDLKGKLVGLSCGELMGLHKREVRAYASGGYYFDEDPIREVEEEVSNWMLQGFTAIKIKIGGLPLEVDLARVRAARRVAGEKVEIMLDANNAWRDVYTASRMMKHFEPYDIAWLEEPLSPDEVMGHQRLRSMSSIPIATGEIESTRWGFAELIRAEAADVLQPDAAVVGGFTEWRRIADTAASFGIPLAPHWFADLHVHCVAAVPNGLWIEYFTDSRILNVMELFEKSLVVKNGRAVVPSEPGIGILLKDRIVDKYATEAWA